MKPAEDWLEEMFGRGNWVVADTITLKAIQRDALLEAFKLVREKHSITGAADAILERSREI